MKGLRKILRVLWTAKKRNEWILNKAGVKRELKDSQSTEASILWSHLVCLEKEITQGTMPRARRRGRPRTAWMDNIKTWTGLSVEVSIRMTEDRDKWRKYVHGVASARIRGRLKNRTEHLLGDMFVAIQTVHPPPSVDFCTTRSSAAVHCESWTLRKNKDTS